MAKTHQDPPDTPVVEDESRDQCGLRTMLWTVIRTPVALGLRKSVHDFLLHVLFCFVLFFLVVFNLLFYFSAGGRNVMFKVSDRVILGHAYFRTREHMANVKL